ncbi:MAG: tetratricopeptide repeat protein [Xanthomonadales bacterium]|jgi:TolB-like protein/cytochrome c-type biogenesis protein CcmH/NrfG|nr:tetratricopeptide repeat protein [Xanthomonadales bacterium]
MSFFAELKRRNVVRVGIAYVLIAWVLLQAADFGLDLIDAPNWVIQALFLVAAIGLPAVLIFSWIFEMTPEGLKLDREVDRGQSVTPETKRRLDRVIIGVLVLVIALLAGERFLPRPEPTTTPPSADPPQVSHSEPAQSIAVLPFLNMSADPDNEYFSDGVAEEVLNALARIPDLKVAARTSAFSFKNSAQPVSQIAAALGVEHVLEGSVRKAGNQVRITAQLVQAGDGFRLWSETYDRQLDDIFRIQDDIAQNIAEALKVTLDLPSSLNERENETDSLEAYELYLQGMGLWHQRSAASLLSAIAAFEAAIELDPEFSRAWSGLALTWSVLPGYTDTPLSLASEKALEAANRALALDPDNVEARLGLASEKMNAGNRQEALRLYDEVIQLQPSLATAWQWRGRALAREGRIEDALASYERAMSLDPRSRIIPYNTAWWHEAAGNTDRARALVSSLLASAPDFPEALVFALTLAVKDGACQDVPQLTSRLEALLGKQQDASPTYRDYCEKSDPGLWAEARDRLVSWGATRAVADPNHPTLSYPPDVLIMLVDRGDHEAAEGLLKDLPHEGPFSDYWRAGRSSDAWNDFVCRPGVQAWMAREQVEFPLQPETCD